MSDTKRILIVEDDSEIRHLLDRFLSKHGYSVSVADDGSDSPWRREPFDLIILDLMLPGEDGLSLCRKIRAQSEAPVIMLTALGGVLDRIKGLEVGADDYLPKPFEPRELLARIRAVMRRANGAKQAISSACAPEDPAEILTFEGRRLDLAKRTLHDPEGQQVSLTGGEFNLLATLAQHPQRTLSRDQLMDILHGRQYEAYDRSIDVMIARLRRKIEPDPGQPKLIQTVRNDGYTLAARVTREQGDPRTG